MRPGIGDYNMWIDCEVSVAVCSWETNRTENLFWEFAVWVAKARIPDPYKANEIVSILVYKWNGITISVLPFPSLPVSMSDSSICMSFNFVDAFVRPKYKYEHRFITGERVKSYKSGLS